MQYSEYEYSRRGATSNGSIIVINDTVNSVPELRQWFDHVFGCKLPCWGLYTTHVSCVCLVVPKDVGSIPAAAAATNVGTTGGSNLVSFAYACFANNMIRIPLKVLFAGNQSIEKIEMFERATTQYKRK